MLFIFQPSLCRFIENAVMYINFNVFIFKIINKLFSTENCVDIHFISPTGGD